MQRARGSSIRRGFAVLGCVAAAAVVGGCGGDDGASADAAKGSNKPFRVLFVVDTTGPAKVYGNEDMIAAKAAVDYWNKHGGVAGRKITLEQVTTNGDPTQAATALTKWIASNGKPDWVFPGTSGGDVTALVPAVKRQKVFGVGVVDGTDGCGTQAQERCPTLFTPGGPTDLAPKYAANWMAEKGYKKVGLLIEQNSYSEGEVPPLEAALKAKGIASVKADFPSSAVDLTPQMSKLTDAGVDVVFAAALGAVPGYVARTREKLGLVDKLPLIFDPGASSADLTKLAPESSLKNAFQQVHRSSDPSTDLKGRDALLAAVKSTGGALTQPILVGAYAWDDMILVKHAAEQAKSTDPDKMAKAMENLSATAASDPLYILSDKIQFTADAHRNVAASPDGFPIIPVGPLKDGVFQSFDS